MTLFRQLLHKHALKTLAIVSVLMILVGMCSAAIVHEIGHMFRPSPEAYFGKSAANGKLELRGGGGGLTNPLLECEVAQDTIASQKVDFSSDLQRYVNTLKGRPGVNEVSVYFRDLNNGPISGVEQNTPFSPASLLKVPIMITYLHEAESDPKLLEKEIVATSVMHDLPISQNIPAEDSVELGKTYTVRELIEWMIAYSDNQAMALLYVNMPAEKQAELYTLLGVSPAIVTDASKQLTVREYSIFFRILFNASYLSRANSEWALKLLTETTFNDGLRKGVPQSIPVGHKFGERSYETGIKQLHDCGIVYYPDHPYLLCVMTRGETTPILTRAIVDISKFIFQKVDDQYGD